MADTGSWIEIRHRRPGTCPLCAGRHPADGRHNEKSMKYMLETYRRSGRAPGPRGEKDEHVEGD